MTDEIKTEAELQRIKERKLREEADAAQAQPTQTADDGEGAPGLGGRGEAKSGARGGQRS